MRIILLSLMMCVLALSAKAQSRDTTVTRTLYYLSDDLLGTGPVDTLTTWSSELGDYIKYSRIDMGVRMNEGIKHNMRATKQFTSAVFCIGIGAAGYLTAAHMDPIIYIEGHGKYTRKYFDRSTRRRDVTVLASSAFTALGTYLMWRSHKNSKKATWCISPNGVKYKF